MKMIVGLGNPGKEYAKTRHNAGFMAIDELAKSLGVTFDQKKYKASYAIYNHLGNKVLLVKPETYMNLSGEAVLALKNYYDIDIEDIIVVHDDLDLPVGKIRIREKGSSGGQNGMKNIINLLHSDGIKRIRIGISKDKQIDTKDYVLGKISKEDMEEFSKAIEKAAKALEFAIDNPFNLVMNRFN